MTTATPPVRLLSLSPSRPCLARTHSFPMRGVETEREKKDDGGAGSWSRGARDGKQRTVREIRRPKDTGRKEAARGGGQGQGNAIRSSRSPDLLPFPPAPPSTSRISHLFPLCTAPSPFIGSTPSPEASLHPPPSSPASGWLSPQRTLVGTFLIPCVV